MTTTFFFRFYNVFTTYHLLDAVLPALPQQGDWVFLGPLGYEVIHRQWQLPLAEDQPIGISLRPLPDETGEVPFSYPQETERLLPDTTGSKGVGYEVDEPPEPP
jgi:hypothetical protein